MRIQALLIIGSLCLSCSVHAQSCPSGIPQGAPGCIPPDNPASPMYPSYAPDPQISRAMWADRWGAIATDAGNGGVGTAAEAASKREAEGLAMIRCRSKGGSNCKISLTYYNQCGAMAWGATHMATAHASSIEKASELALDSCAADSADCEIYYADCSLPEPLL